MVWILPVSRQAGEVVSPARRDGSAATHLEGLLLFMQDGPPPSSRTRHGATPVAQRQPSEASLSLGPECGHTGAMDDRGRRWRTR